MNSRKFLGFGAIALILAINQQFGSASTSCDNSRCAQEASKINDYVDTSSNPCEDFYQFACGKFLKNKQTNEKYRMWKNLKAKYEHQLTEVAQEDIQENDHKMVKAAKQFYRSCLDVDKILPDFVKTIGKMLETVGGWPLAEGPSWNESNFNWINASYELRRQGFAYDPFLEVTVRDNVLSVFQERMRFGIPDLERTPKVAMLFGAKNEEEIKQELSQTYHGFDYMWLNSGNPDYTKVTVEDIQRGDSDIDWLEFLNNIVGPKIHISKTDEIYFPMYGYISSGVRKLAEVPKRYQANYMIWEAIRPFYRYVEEVQSQRNASWHTKNSRETYCATTTTKLLTTMVPNPLDVIKLRKHLPQEKKAHLEKMVANIKAASIESLNKFDWISDNIKQKYIKKITDHKVIIGLSGDYFDDKMLDDADIDMGEVKDDATFFDLIRQTNRNLESLKYMQLKTDLKELPESPYAPAESTTLFRENFFYIPIILCEEPFFDENRPASLNYASLGTLISKFLFKEFWGEIRGEENSLKTCLLGKNPEENNNKQTVELEAVKMNVAQQIAQIAYEKSIKAHGADSNLPSIAYSPNQLFWISFGSLNCEPTDEYEYVRMSFSHKELNSDIVSESVRLNPNFARDFNCPVDSKLNPSNRCKIF